MTAHPLHRLLPAVLGIAILLAIASTTPAQEDAAGDEDALELERLQVTGSRISRAQVEGPVPVITIEREDLEKRGYATVYEALRNLSVNNGPVLEIPESGLFGFSPDVQTLNLRSFGEGTTLTLINGRRVANYPVAYQTDKTVFSYGSIPVAAIERIEVLANSASAVYGSDAIAGVINILLRDDIDTTIVNGLWGTPTESKSTVDEWRFQLVNGQVFERGGYTLTLEHLDREPIVGADFSRFDDQRDDYPYGQGVYNRALLTQDLPRFFFRVFPDYRDPAEILGTSGEAACAGTGAGLIHQFREDRGYFCADPNAGVPEINLRNGRESWSAYLNTYLEVGDGDTELFADFLYYDSESRAHNTDFGLVEEVLDLTRPDTIGVGFFDWTAPQRIFTSAELGMDLNLHFEDQAWTAVGGARGSWNVLHDWEVSLSYSEYDYAASRPWFKWREVIDNFLGAWLGVSLIGTDWWSAGTLGGDLGFPLGVAEVLYGPANDAVLQTIGRQTYANESTDTLLNFTFTGDLGTFRSRRVSYATIAEYEDIEIDYIPDALITQPAPTTDANGDPITRTLDGSGWYRLTGYTGKGSRDRWALGGELRVPLHDMLIVNLAARYDRYDSRSTSFGSDLTPSASIEWRPVQRFLLRAGYAESFRAPDMAAVFTRTGDVTSVFDWVSCYEQYVARTGSDEGFDTADCTRIDVFTQRLGPQDVNLEPLDAETGDNWWVGFSWDLLKNLNATVDYSELTLEQRVLTQTAQSVLDDEWRCFLGQEPQRASCDRIGEQARRVTDTATGLSALDDLFITSFNAARDFGRFLDVRLRYTLDTGAGLFDFDGHYSHVLERELRVLADSQPIDLRDDPRFSPGSFRSSFTGSLAWNRRAFSTTLTAIYRGSSTRIRCFAGCISQLTGEDYLETGNTRVGSYTTWNWTAQYQWTSQLMTRLRVLNVLDEAPPRDDTFFSQDDPWYNAFLFPGAGIGRYAAIEVEYAFN